MIFLGRYRNRPVLCHCSTDGTGATLSGGFCPGLQADGFQRSESRGDWIMIVRTAEGVTFYREVRWNGLRVTPLMWKYGAVEPLLEYIMDQSELATGSWELTAPRIQALEAQGWKYKPREGLFRAVHVNELEPIEGTPPEDAFRKD